MVPGASAGGDAPSGNPDVDADATLSGETSADVIGGADRLDDVVAADEALP